MILILVWPIFDLGECHKISWPQFSYLENGGVDDLSDRV